MCSVHNYSIAPTLKTEEEGITLACTESKHSILKQICAFHKTVAYLNKHKGVDCTNHAE